MGYDNLLFDQFIYGATLNNTNLSKPEVANVWFEHTEKKHERAIFRAYNNIDYVTFLNVIDLEIINNFIVELWNVYKRKYTYSSKEDFIKSVWQFTIYEIEDFLKETYYHSGYNCKGFELWFCNDKNDITNNLWFFLDEDKDPDYYKQYYKKVLELLISFKMVNSNDNKNMPPPEPKTPITDQKTFTFKDTINTMNELEKVFLKLGDTKGETIQEMRLKRDIQKLRLQNLENDKKTLKDKNSKEPPPELKTPFTDQKTHDLFNYIVDNWDYKANLKYGYILNFLNSNEKYLPLPKYNLKENYKFKMGVKYRSEYIEFIGKQHNFYKDIQPEKAVSIKQYDELLKHYKEFCEIYV